MARIKDIKHLKFKHLIKDLDNYGGLGDGLIQLPLPEVIKIGLKDMNIPKDMDEFCDSICYGQRLFLAQKEDNDIGVILRVMDGYYYPLVTNKPWNEEAALSFGKKILNCSVEELYPTAMHIVTLVSEMADREKKLLHREPSKIEKAAGIDKLAVFSELSAIDFLRRSMDKTEEEVMLTPYNECLVRFMMEKETNDFHERFMKEREQQDKATAKFKKP